MFSRSLRSPRLINGARMARSFSQTAQIRAFDRQLEEDIRRRIDELPPFSRIFQNSDGSPRQPADEELKKLAQLQSLAQKRSLSWTDYVSLPKSEVFLYTDNHTDLQEFQASSQKILDKVPYEDSKTGELKWQVIRQDEKEGWENLMYYFFVPCLWLMGAIVIFKDNEGIDKWALDELRLRVQETISGSEDSAKQALSNTNKTAEEIKDRDIEIVERILSGKYDKLAGLRINTPALPIIAGEREEAPVQQKIFK